MYYLDQLTNTILEIVRLIDFGGRIDPDETLAHIWDGSIWRWLAEQFRDSYSVNFLCGFVRQDKEPAPWEDAGVEIAFALAYYVLPAHNRCCNNGLCVLVEMIDRLIDFRQWQPRQATQPNRAGVSNLEGDDLDSVYKAPNGRAL